MSVRISQNKVIKELVRHLENCATISGGGETKCDLSALTNNTPGNGPRAWILSIDLTREPQKTWNFQHARDPFKLL